MQPHQRTPLTPSSTQYKMPENKSNSQTKPESTTLNQNEQASVPVLPGLGYDQFGGADTLSYQARDQRRQFEKRPEIQPTVSTQKNPGSRNASSETQSLTRGVPGNYGTGSGMPVPKEEEKCIVM